MMKGKILLIVLIVGLIMIPVSATIQETTYETKNGLNQNLGDYTYEYAKINFSKGIPVRIEQTVDIWDGFPSINKVGTFELTKDGHTIGTGTITHTTDAASGGLERHHIIFDFNNDWNNPGYSGVVTGIKFNITSGSAHREYDTNDYSAGSSAKAIFVLYRATGGKMHYGTWEAEYSDLSDTDLNFTATPNSGYIPLVSTFALSDPYAPKSGSINKWIFGDGNTTYLIGSSGITHTYTNGGSYTPSFTYFDQLNTSKTITISDYITVYEAAPPQPSFTCSNSYDAMPYQSPYPLYCWDDGSIVYPAETSHEWKLSQPDGTSVLSSNTSLVRTLTEIGVYGLEYEICNDFGCGYANSTTLLNITSDSVLVSGLTVNLDIKNSISGALIADSAVGIKNTTTGVWRNSTAPTGLVYFDSTDPGYAYPLSQNQTITLAASKTGYSPASTTFAIPYDNYRAYLYLVPGTVTNATGAGTVVVSVLRQKTGLPISGVSVVMDSEGGGQIGMTNSAGSVTLMNVTAGSRTLIASDSGYQTVEKAFDLAAGETKLVSVELVLDGETPVPTYVTPGPTYDPDVVPTYNPDDPFNETYLNNGNYTPGELNQRGSAGLMAMIGSLLQLWPAILMLGFIKLVKEAFS